MDDDAEPLTKTGRRGPCRICHRAGADAYIPVHLGCHEHAIAFLPWTASQLENLRYHQVSRSMHPYTCGGGGGPCEGGVVLNPTPNGLVCPRCGRVQTSVHSWSLTSQLREIDEATGHPVFLCPRCGAVSHHPEDYRNGYCGRCHDFTGKPTGG